MTALLDVREVRVEFPIRQGLFRKPRILHAVDGVSFTVKRGEVLSLVGESGCGKSTLAKTLLGIHAPTSGCVTFAGKDLKELDRREIARQIQPVFQDPYSSLNPRKTVEDLIALPLDIRAQATSSQRREAVVEIMGLVGLSRRSIHAYPSQLSGGQRQRVAIARALITRPELVVCDEPTSALDVSVQAQILNLLQDLKDKLNLTYVFISHDLNVVRHFSDRVAVMYLGRVVELGNTEEVLGRSLHPYTRKLKQGVLVPDPSHRLPPPIFDGGFPDPTNPPSGCHFHPRCPDAGEACTARRPGTVRHGNSTVACHLYTGLATGHDAANEKLEDA